MSENDCVALFSGGESSLAAILVWQYLFPGARVAAVFHDTRVEDEDLYRFVSEVVGELSAVSGFEFFDVSDGGDVWDVQVRRGYLANTRVDVCSQELKRSIGREWIRQKHHSRKVVIGLDWKEIHRYERAVKSWPEGVLQAPLIEHGALGARLLSEFYSATAIARPRLYDMGFPHNNCGGFCVKAGLAQFKLLLEKFPERYLWHEERQEGAFAAVGRYPFLRKSVDGVVHYISLREYRLFLQRGVLVVDGEVVVSGGGCSPSDDDDWGGCGCAV